METGRFSNWQSERNTSEGDESKPESDKKKKRRRDDSGSAQTRNTGATGETGPKEKETAEHRRARRALADIIVENGAASEAKTSDLAKKKESDEPKISGESVRKPFLSELEREVAERPGSSAADEKVSERGKTERPGEADREEGVPYPERNHLRPGELYGGEFVLNLQDNKSPAEREIPLHEAPVAARAPKAAERAAGPEPESVLTVDHKPEGPAEIPRDKAEYEPNAEPRSEKAPSFEPLVPPILQPQAEQSGQTRAFGLPQSEHFVPTASAHAAEAPALGVTPEADSAAVVPNTPGFAAVPAAEAAHRLEPVEAYPMNGYQPAAHEAGGSGSGEPMVTKKEADDAAYYAARSAQSRGLAAGFLVAALWARHRGKKLRRNFNELLGKQDKKLEQTNEDQRFYAAEQTRKQAENDRRLTAAEQRYTYAEKQLAGVPRAEAPPLPPEVIAQMQKNQLARLPERSAGDVPDQLNVPPEHRLETSAWHTIEIDARTGRPVEQPTFVYGHEYYRERSHESAPVTQRNAVAGEVALVGASVAGSPTGSGGSSDNSAGSGSITPPSNIPDASRQGVPHGSSATKASSARDSVTRVAASGPIWPLVLALLIIFVVLIVLLH